MLIRFSFFLITLIIFSKLHSSIEKMAIKKPSNNILKFIETSSLKLFKKIRLLLFMIGAFEATLIGSHQSNLFVVGIIILLIGIILRILAIFSLGNFWSFNVMLYENHQVVRTGIYRILRHPAYLGNVYLVGLFLCLGSLITSTLALIFIALFYIYRANLEENLLSSVESM